MPRYKLTQDFGGMKAGDEIVTEQLSDMLKPVAVEIEEAKLEVATPEVPLISQSANTISAKRPSNGNHHPARGGAIHQKAGF